MINYINEEEWPHGVKDFGQRFGCAMGAQRELTQYGAHLEKKWLQGIRANQRLYMAA